MGPRSESTEFFTEDDIRPDSLREQQRAAYERDIARVLTRKSEFVDVACPACASEEAEPSFEKFSLLFLRCRGCGTVYQSPRPTPAILDYYYTTSENYSFWNKHIFPLSEDARRRNIFRPRLDRLIEICDRNAVPRHVLVDVGAGFGTFGQEALSTGSFERVIAIEPTPELAEACRGRGLEVQPQPLETIEGGSIAAEVVTAFEVIEHVFDPSKFIRSCREMLVEGGLLVLTCPNIEGFDLMILRELSDTIDLEHLNYFSPRSLQTLVSSSGLKVVEVGTPGVLDAELVRKAVLKGELSLDDQPFLHRVLVEEWERSGTPFQSFLRETGMSSHLWLVARREG